MIVVAGNEPPSYPRWTAPAASRRREHSLHAADPECPGCLAVKSPLDLLATPRISLRGQLALLRQNPYQPSRGHAPLASQQLGSPDGEPLVERVRTAPGIQEGSLALRRTGRSLTILSTNTVHRRLFQSGQPDGVAALHLAVPPVGIGDQFIQLRHQRLSHRAHPVRAAVVLLAVPGATLRSGSPPVVTLRRG